MTQSLSETIPPGELETPDYTDLELDDYTETLLEALEEQSIIPENKLSPRLFRDVKSNEKGRQILVEYESADKILIARDRTSTSSGLFGLVLDRIHEETHKIESIEEGLDLLKPDPVKSAEEDPGKDVQRQGEWWFVETSYNPEYSLNGETESKPYGPSPLDNHVPSQYSFGVPRDEAYTKLKSELSTNQDRDDIPGLIEEAETSFEPRDLLELLEGVYVTGSVHHRQDEHPELNLGENWYRAYTHGRTAYQPDPSAYSEEGVEMDAFLFTD